MAISISTDLLSNPIAIHKHALDELQNRLLGTGEYIVDANNVVDFILEMQSTLTATQAAKVDNVHNALYRQRAQTATDIFRHLSDYDFISLFANPSSCTLAMFLNKQQLMDEAVDYNDNYKKVIIPQNTIFKISQYYFGIYYPIEIQISKQTGAFLCMHDTSEVNPLFALSTNVVEHRFTTEQGVPKVVIKFPVYQFEKIDYTEDAVANIGFSKKYRYNNSFYTARVYHKKNGVWNEMKISLSETIYSTATPTAKLIVESTTNTIQIQIPQVYFTENLVGTQIWIEIYTTMGALDEDISQLPISSFTANFIGNSPDATWGTYTEILNHPQTMYIVPISTKILGGSDAKTLAEIADESIHAVGDATLIVTPGNLKNHFKKLGYQLIKYQDGIQDRIYFAYRDLTDVNAVTIPSGNLSMYLTAANIANVSTITKSSDGSITILPSTIFLFNPVSGVCEPLTDTERQSLTVSNSAIVAGCNNHNYLKSPMHIRFNMNDKAPVAYSYNLNNPKINDILFVTERKGMVSQAVIYKATISHLLAGVGGYKLQLFVQLSEDMATIDPADLQIEISIPTSTGATVAAYATYNDNATNTINNGMLVYDITISTDYAVNVNHKLHVTNLNCIQSNSSSNYLALAFTMKAVFLLKTSVL